MTKVNITTLTPVHIGSGTMLLYNSDFVPVRKVNSGDKYLQVIDDRRILDLIGAEHIDDWILSIERGDDTKDFVKRFAPNSKYIDYSKRRLYSFIDEKVLKQGTTLKEQMHDGLGIPYIPGSSIKGAIRSCVLASLAHNVSEKEEKISVQDKRGNSIPNKYSAKRIEDELFGNMTNDIFRFIHVGDAFFPKDSEVAIMLEMYLNITQTDSLRPKSDKKPQIVEAIGMEEKTSFEIRIKKDTYQWAKSQLQSLGTMPVEMEELPSLFKLINKHTAKLVDEEIEYWSEIDKAGAENYLETMSDIRDEISACVPGKECVLRLGHAIGWRFTTGAWAEPLGNFDRIVSVSRPNNRNYLDYDFPKSRRADKDGDLLGFIKMTIAE